MIYQTLLWSWQWPREDLFFLCITGVFPTGCWCCGIYALIYFLSFTGIPLGSHPRAGVLLRLPHWALLAARRRRQAALQWDAQHQLCCRGEVLPGLPDAGARYSSSPAMPGLDPLLRERAPRTISASPSCSRWEPLSLQQSYPLWLISQQEFRRHPCSKFPSCSHVRKHASFQVLFPIILLLNSTASPSEKWFCRWREKVEPGEPNPETPGDKDPVVWFESCSLSAHPAPR